MHPVLIFALVASWPGIAVKHRPLLILLALPFAFLGMLLDVPLMLWGAVEDLLYWQVNPARVAESLGSRVQGVLDGGGRYAIAIGFALLAVVLFRMIVLGQPLPRSSAAGRTHSPSPARGRRWPAGPDEGRDRKFRDIIRDMAGRAVSPRRQAARRLPDTTNPAGSEPRA